MRLTIDREADALLLILREGPWKRTQRAAKDVNLELGNNNEVMAIEVLNLSQQVGSSLANHFDLRFTPPLDPTETSMD